jgi:hypothetical protein
MVIEAIGGISGQFNIDDRYSEEDKTRLRKRIQLESKLNYQNLHNYTPLISMLKYEYKQENNEEFTGDIKTLVDDYANDMTWFEDNEYTMMKVASQDRSDQQKYNLGLKMHIWDRVHNRDWWKIAQDHTAAMVSSPTNIASVVLAPFTLGQSFWLKAGATIAKEAGKQAIKQSFLKTISGKIQKNIHKNIVKTVALEAGLGGLGEGVHQFYRQDVEQEVLRPEDLQPFRDEKDYETVLLASSIGAVTAGGVTAGLYIGGKALKSFITKQMAQGADKPFGRTPFEELRIDTTPDKTIVGRFMGSRVVEHIKRGLTSSAGMPQQLADIASNHRRQLTAKDALIQRNIADFEVLFKKENNGANFESLSEADMLPYLKLLHGDDSLAGAVPASIRKSLLGLRKNIADATQYALDSGMVKGKTLLGKMEAGVKNQNYVNRSYRVHTDEKWSEKMQSAEGLERWNNAKTYLQGLYKESKDINTEAKIDAMLIDIVSESPHMEEVLGILKGRQDIPEQIRKLMGENIDVRDVYRNTIRKVYASAADYEFRTKFADMGGDLGFLTRTGRKGLERLSTSRDFSLDAEGLTKVLGDLDAKEIVTNPLDGMFSHPAFVRAYGSMRGESARLGEAQNTLTAIGAAANGLFSIGHTVYSPMTVSRNLGGGGILNLAAGNWINPIQKAMHRSKFGSWESHDKEMTGVSTLFKKLVRKSDIGDEELNLLREGVEYGVFQQSVRAEVLHRNLKDFSNISKKGKEWGRAIEAGTGGFGTAKALRQMKRKGIEVPVEFYGLMDDLNKLWAWDTEFRNFKLSYGNSEGKFFIPKRLALSSNYGGISIPSGKHTSTTLGGFAKDAGEMVEVDEKILKAMAAKKSTLYYPTYDQIPPWIKNLRKMPLGNFVAFPAEMTRNTKNNLMIGLEEIYSGNRVMTARGMARLASLATVAGGVGGGVTGITAAGLSYITGEEVDMTPEQVDAFRNTVPHAIGNEFFFQSKQVKGDKSIIKAINLSFSDPYSTFKVPIRIAMMAYQNGDDLNTAKSKTAAAIWDGSWEYFESFLGTKEGLKPFMKLLLHEETDDIEWDRTLETFYKTFTPKVIQEGIGFGSNWDKEHTEWGSHVPHIADWATGILSGGLKSQEYDLDMSASRTLAKLQRQSVAARRGYKKLIEHKGQKNRMTPSQIRELQDEMRKGIEEDIDIQKQIWAVVKNLRTLNMSEQNITSIMSHDTDITERKGVGKRLSGSPMSPSKIRNYTSTNPLYYQENISKLKAVINLNNRTYSAMQDVIREYNNVPLNK